MEKASSQSKVDEKINFRNYSSQISIKIPLQGIVAGFFLIYLSPQVSSVSSVSVPPVNSGNFTWTLFYFLYYLVIKFNFPTGCYLMVAFITNL